MSASKREGMTLVFFLTTLAVAGLATGLTRLFLHMRWTRVDTFLIPIGLIFLVFTILTLGLED